MLSVKYILTGWMMNSGIYRITNKLNNKRYIGSAVNLAARWRTHRFRLSNNNHHSIKLQRSWSKHGEDTFTFEVLEEVIKPSNITKKEWRSLILSREQYYLDILLFASCKDDRFDKLGYNICRKAGSSLGVVRSSTSRLRMKQAQVNTSNHPWRGHNLSKEHRAKISLALTGKTFQDSTRQLISKNSAIRKLSDDDRNEILCLLDKGIYQKDIAKQFGVTQSTISWIHNRKFLEV